MSTPKPLSAEDQAWIEKGWQAYKRTPLTHQPKPLTLEEIREANADAIDHSNRVCVMEPEDATAQAVTIQKRNIALYLRKALEKPNTADLIEQLAEQLEK